MLIDEKKYGSGVKLASIIVTLLQLSTIILVKTKGTNFGFSSNVIEPYRNERKLYEL